MPVIDIGIGGMGLDITGTSIDYAAGTMFPEATIDLGTFGRVTTAIEIRFTTRAQRNGKEIAHMGSRFVKLSSAMEHSLQRYLTHIQREIKSHSL